MVLSVTSEPSRVETSSGRKANRRQRKAESLMFLFGKRTSRKNMAERISNSIDLERGKGTTARCCRINTSRSHGELGVELWGCSSLSSGRVSIKEALCQSPAVFARGKGGEDVGSLLTGQYFYF